MSKNTDPTSPNASPTPWNHPRVIANHKARQRRDLLARILAVACVLAILIPLGDLLLTFVVRGIELTTLPRLLDDTSHGGISNDIVGTGLLTLLSSAIAIPLGIFGGVYMSEFSKNGKFAEGLRFSADVLAGIPSIVLGYSIYLILVLYAGLGFSAVAGAVALSVIMFPYIFRTTEISIKKVPENIKEGAIALGSTKTTMINKLALKFAMPGIVTGILLAIGISLSETAPLLYTAGYGSFTPDKLSELIHFQIGYLTGVIWTNYTASSVASQYDLAFVATFILILIVLLLNIVARLGLRKFSKV